MNLQTRTTKERADRVDTDIFWSILGCETFGCVRHGCFAGVIPDETWTRPRGAGGSDIDYRASFSLIDEIGNDMSCRLGFREYLYLSPGLRICHPENEGVPKKLTWKMLRTLTLNTKSNSSSVTSADG